MLAVNDLPVQIVVTVRETLQEMIEDTFSSKAASLSPADLRAWATTLEAVQLLEYLETLHDEATVDGATKRLHAVMTADESVLETIEEEAAILLEDDDTLARLES